MANVSTRTANWRLFGGGGLAVGGLLWALHAVLVRAGVLALGPWVYVIALIVLGAALLFVAFGETGSNGAVGNNVLGKIALVIYAAGFVVVAVNAFASLGGVTPVLAVNLIINGGLLSAFVIYYEGIAKGIARWALFVPALLGQLWAFGFFALPSFSDLWWIPLLVALSLLATGVFYLFNSRKRG